MSSPSGAGKTTLSRMLIEADGNIAMSISVTTRKARPGEVDGGLALAGHLAVDVLLALVGAVLGAGGAARSVVWALADAGAATVAVVEPS